MISNKELIQELEELDIAYSNYMGELTYSDIDTKQFKKLCEFDVKLHRLILKFKKNYFEK